MYYIIVMHIFVLNGNDFVTDIKPGFYIYVSRYEFMVEFFISIFVGVMFLISHIQNALCNPWLFADIFFNFLWGYG